MTQDTQTPPALGVPVGTWTVDPSASEVGFAVRTFWGVLNVKGVFERFEGTLDVSPDAAGGSLQIQAASLSTHNPKRDEHLRSEHFFDVERNPLVAFSVGSLAPRPGGFQVTGELVVAERTVPLKLDVDASEAGDGELRLRAATTIPRAEAGLGWNQMGMLRPNAHLHADILLRRD